MYVAKSLESQQAWKSKCSLVFSILKVIFLQRDRMNLHHKDHNQQFLPVGGPSLW